jgi:hypothetical protein
MPVMRARAAEEGGEEGAAHSATSGAYPLSYPLLPADRCYPFPLYPYLSRLRTSSVQGFDRAMTRSSLKEREYREVFFNKKYTLVGGRGAPVEHVGSGGVRHGVEGS